ncbi:hypothetical protein N7462_008191 [Penicillium macrosclerotiorum]|uniref:uncharacterized protein n=1 Tax=Penicillium macrosclerotiorum TaxID=303699 RepID=UPI002546A64D|nr:uncharacterized protein N7462_008191 [Penicillium macrosclerotiorum]KAJ5679947.1 hypothetical protein N7462_008191 [Penicillium macrosclerotiorum]
MPAPTLSIKTPLVEQCEEAEVIHIQRQGETYAKLHPDKSVVVRPIPQGGVAIRTMFAFDGKLNRAVGCGKEGDMHDTTLRDLDLTFAIIGLSPELHLSPLATSLTFQSLITRGYVEKYELTTYWGAPERLNTIESPNRATGEMAVMTRRVTTHELNHFIETSAAGFQSNGRPPELLRTLARIATQRQDTRLYFALMGGEIVGTAALATIDTSHGSVAHLYLDSTLPRHRGRGVQLALIQARLQEAQQLRLPLVTTITRTGDGSARNAGRAGLRVAYTIPVLTRPKTL